MFVCQCSTHFCFESDKHDHLLSAPTVSLTPKNLAGVERSVVHYVCRIVGSGKPAITWFKNGAPNVGRGTWVLTLQDGSSLLRIRLATLRGVTKLSESYSCQADNGVDAPVSDSATLTVYSGWWTMYSHFFFWFFPFDKEKPPFSPPPPPQKKGGGRGGGGGKAGTVALFSEFWTAARAFKRTIFPPQFLPARLFLLFRLSSLVPFRCRLLSSMVSCAYDVCCGLKGTFCGLFITTTIIFYSVPALALVIKVFLALPKTAIPLTESICFCIRFDYCYFYRNKSQLVSCSDNLACLCYLHRSLLTDNNDFLKD